MKNSIFILIVLSCLMIPATSSLALSVCDYGDTKKLSKNDTWGERSECNCGYAVIQGGVAGYYESVPDSIWIVVEADHGKLTNETWGQTYASRWNGTYYGWLWNCRRTPMVDRPGAGFFVGSCGRVFADYYLDKSYRAVCAK